jgi:hypothetical protein
MHAPFKTEVYDMDFDEADKENGRERFDQLYGFFLGGGRADRKWGMTYNRTEAFNKAAAHKGQVRAMRDPENSGAWDAPTFTMCSILLADFAQA